MNEGDYIGDCINTKKLLAKELANADNSVSDKMQVTTILNNLPPSWDHIVTTLTHSGKKSHYDIIACFVSFWRRKNENQNNKLKQFLNQELLNDNGKIHHFHIYIKIKIKIKKFNERGQISKDIMENQNMLVIIVEDLDILGLIVLIIIITKIMNQIRL